MALPELTAEQRAAALEKAAQSRRERAALRDAIKNGEKTPEEVLNDVENPVVARMKVSMFIETIPGFGKAKTEKLMEELGISPTRRIKGLGSRQREELLERLGGN